MDKRPLQKHSKLSKKPWSPSVVGSIICESLEDVYSIYYAIGASMSSLHRESTDFLIISLTLLTYIPHTITVRNVTVPNIVEVGVPITATIANVWLVSITIALGSITD